MSLGNIIQILLILASVAAGWAKLEAEGRHNRLMIEKQDQTIGDMRDDFRDALAAAEGRLTGEQRELRTRLRSQEIVAAQTVSQYSQIMDAIRRLESRLDRAEEGGG